MFLGDGELDFRGEDRFSEETLGFREETLGFREKLGLDVYC